MNNSIVDKFHNHHPELVSGSYFYLVPGINLSAVQADFE
jgi:hypothetical protein